MHLFFQGYVITIMIILHKESKEKILDFGDIKESTAQANVHGDSKKNQP